jgi:hypothetical protein
LMLVMTSMFVPERSARFSSFRYGESCECAAEIREKANTIPKSHLISFHSLNKFWSSLVLKSQAQTDFEQTQPLRLAA